MIDQTNNLEIGLLDNGSHSLKRDYEVWSQWGESRDNWLLKESAIWIHHWIELLFKQLIVQANEFLVFQDVNNIAINYFRRVVGVALKLLTMTLLVGVAISIMDGYYAALSENAEMQELMIIFVVVSVHSKTSCHPAEIRPTVTSHVPTRGYPHEKAPHTRAVAGAG